MPTPALVVEREPLRHNIETIGRTLPGERLRPHVKAFKSTSLARMLAEAGHLGFTCATVREAEGMAAAGLGHDLLLANEVLDRAQLRRLAAVEGNVTLAVDSSEGVARAADAGIGSVLIDIDVGLPRCGAAPSEAGPLAETARRRGLNVRGVMGYEGHLMMVIDRAERTARVQAAMAKLLAAAEDAGGDVISAGGTGTYDVNVWATEIQAGSFLLGDTDYARLDLPFRQAIHVEASVISRSARGHIVVNAGLKALGMDHGNPSWDGGEVLYCSDEHTVLRPAEAPGPGLDERVRLAPAHLDPTVARHQRMWLVDGGEVIGELPVDLRHW